MLKKLPEIQIIRIQLNTSPLNGMALRIFLKVIRHTNTKTTWNETHNR